MSGPAGPGELDLAGVGIGPFNLALAALASPVAGLRTALFERRPEFRWHPGLLLEEATLQVPFLADLVSLVDPTSPLSFLNYLRERGRLFPFYFAERFHVPRTEYDDYGRWAATRLGNCHFGRAVRRIDWLPGPGRFELTLAGAEPVRAGAVVLGLGTVPSVPAPLRSLVDDPAVTVTHSADYLAMRDRLLAAPRIAVIGSGQSGAEVFLDLLRRRPAAEGLSWFSRTRSFAPMEYSKLGLEQFTPDYTDFFHGLAEPVRDRLLPRQWQLYKGIDADTLAAIHEELYRRGIGGGWPGARLTPGAEVVRAGRDGTGIELELRHRDQDRGETLRVDAVVAATGYTEASAADLLAPLAGMLVTDEGGRLVVERDHRLRTSPELGGAIYVQNAQRHTHGVGAPDLGLAAWHSATIINSLCGRVVYELPQRTAFTSFGLAATEEP